MRELKKWGPEYFTVRIYTELFTRARVPIFFGLLIFCCIDFVCLKLDTMQWLPLWNQSLFTSIATKMIYLLLSVGGFTAAFFTLCIEIIKTKLEAKEITYLWSNLIKYTSYPFVVAMLISVTLFLEAAGVYNHLYFSTFLLFVYLTINSFYTTIKMAEILVNEASRV